MEASIALKDVSKRYLYGSVLDQISFGVERGTIFGIVGPSGSGKTTLLEILATLKAPDSGSIFIHGMPIHEQPRRVRQMSGYVPEQSTLNPQGTVFENLRLHGLLFGFSPKQADIRARELLNRFQLTDYSGEFPESLPLGALRLLLFSRAVLHKPDLLYLDEPTQGLDYSMRKALWEQLHMYRGEMTICFATGSVSEAEKHADRYIVLHRGKVLTDRLHEDMRNLIQRDTEYYLTLAHPAGAAREQLASLDSLYNLEEDGEQVKFHLERSGDFVKVVEILGGQTIRDIRVMEPDLNRIILDLTKEEFLE